MTIPTANPTSPVPPQAPNITHEHIAYLKSLRLSVQRFKVASATKQKLIMDMMHHGLVTVKDDLIYVEDKARDMVHHIESETKQWLNSHL
jgi:hypothetical protein